MLNILQTNKFSHISDDDRIFFTKIDHLEQTIYEIERKNKKCVLITGNGDLPLYDFMEQQIPKNVVKIFAQNNVTNSDRVISLPLGIGNSDECRKSGHGEHYPINQEKLNFLERVARTNPTNNEIYCNFNNETNPKHRIRIKEISNKLSYVKVEHETLNISDYYNSIISKKYTICPIGNGLDTHRVWDVLYCYRVPIVFKMNQTKSYSWQEKNIGLFKQLYDKLPIVVLENEDDLNDIDLINSKYEEVSDNWSNLQFLNCNYWIETIRNALI